MLLLDRALHIVKIRISPSPDWHVSSTKPDGSGWNPAQRRRTAIAVFL